jgi:hypothetical protein
MRLCNLIVRDASGCRTFSLPIELNRSRHGSAARFAGHPAGMTPRERTRQKAPRSLWAGLAHWRRSIRHPQNVMDTGYEETLGCHFYLWAADSASVSRATAFRASCFVRCRLIRDISEASLRFQVPRISPA